CATAPPAGRIERLPCDPNDPSCGDDGKSDPGGGSSGDDGTAHDAGPHDPHGAKDDPTANDPSPAAPAAASGPCGNTKTAIACSTCCENLHPQGNAVWQGAFGDCACASPGVCAEACEQTWCAGGQPIAGDACDAC